MKKPILLLLGMFALLDLPAQETLDYFLPDDVNYLEEIPSPDVYFSQLPGEWHLSHAQVLGYFREIARISPRAVLREYARSYENNPLVHLVFTSEENQGRLEELRELHRRFSEPGADVSADEVALVVNLGYGVHGNESSATNSSVLTAYYLAAAQGDKVDSLLNSTIILVDPCLNPDGYSRHSSWANSYQSVVDNGDENSRQFRERWPRGRSNHYWFDLNRDYLPLVNPESIGRVQAFHEWMPNVVTDHHESSPNFSFFFQPGIPSRNNPLIPEGNYTLTSAIAAYHASYLDRIGSSYFSEEVFDDYYFGKGSTYPDINGSIGILFEQSSIRGRIRETDNGIKTLAFGMRNQFTVTLSTLQAAMDLRNELLEYQKAFYRNAQNEAKNSEVRAYVFGSANDRVKTAEFAELLHRHQIKVYALEKDVKVGNSLYTPSFSYIVPVEQKQYRMIRTIFEEVTAFRDTSFYDISSWTMTHAYDVQNSQLLSLKSVQWSKDPIKALEITGKVYGAKSKIAYLFRWDEHSAPQALYELQNAGLRTRVATKDFSIRESGSLERFSNGTVQVKVANQGMSEQAIYDLVRSIAERTGVDFYALTTGFTPEGIDMGSSSFAHLEKPRILMFIEGSTSSGIAGSSWHLLDQRYQIPVTLSSGESIGSVNLDAYTCLILPGGSFREWDEKEVTELRRWVEKGGTLIACGTAADWLSKNGLGKTTYKKAVPEDSTRYLSYADRRRESTLQGIGGVILKAKLDITHPLCYGYTENTLAMFKRRSTVAKTLGEKYLEPVSFTHEPYMSGWISPENLERVKDAPVLSIQKLGRGKLISFHEEMNFRGFWLGTQKLFMNAIFFGTIVP